MELAPLNVLVGANGSGKSTLLALLRVMRSLSQGELAAYVGKSGGADEVLRSAPPTEKLDLDLALLTITGHSRYKVLLERTDDNGLIIRHEALERFDPDGKARGSEVHSRPMRESEWGESSRWGSEHKLFSQFRKYHFANTAMAAPTHSNAMWRTITSSARTAATCRRSSTGWSGPTRPPCGGSRPRFATPSPNSTDLR